MGGDNGGSVLKAVLILAALQLNNKIFCRNCTLYTIVEMGDMVLIQYFFFFLPAQF